MGAQGHTWLSTQCSQMSMLCRAQVAEPRIPLINCVNSRSLEASLTLQGSVLRGRGGAITFKNAVHCPVGKLRNLSDPAGPGSLLWKHLQAVQEEVRQTVSATTAGVQPAYNKGSRRRRRDLVRGRRRDLVLRRSCRLGRQLGCGLWLLA